jgi:hypothetical protein
MSTYDDIDEDDRRFLLELFEQACGETSAKVSMFTVGDGLGLDRQAASRIGENLMGLGLVEVRTLAGAIGMTEDGAAAARHFGAGGGPEKDAVRLGTDGVLGDTVRRAVTEVTEGLKGECGKLGLDFDPLSELVADLKTIDTQCMSPRPKSAIIRECFQSIRTTLGQGKAKQWADRIDRLLGQR